MPLTLGTGRAHAVVAGPSTGSLLFAAGVGLVWGAATSGLQTVLPWPVAGLANAVSPWVAVAFAVGVCLPRTWLAVAAGVLVCWGEVAGYYGVSALRGFGVHLPTVAVWLVAAVPGGAVSAAAGHAWAHARRPGWSQLGAALLAGAFLVEGLVTYGWVLGYLGDAVVFTAIGVVLVVVLPLRGRLGGGSRRRAVAGTVGWLVPVAALGVAGTALTGAVLG